MGGEFILNNILLHDKYEKEFFKSKSPNSLKYLIENGRELEFTINNHSGFISKNSSEKYCSLWVDNIEQGFCSVSELIKNAEIDGELLLNLLDKIEIITIF